MRWVRLPSIGRQCNCIAWLLRLTCWHRNVGCRMTRTRWIFRLTVKSTAKTWAVVTETLTGECGRPSSSSADRRLPMAALNSFCVVQEETKITALQFVYTLRALPRTLDLISILFIIHVLMYTNLWVGNLLSNPKLFLFRSLKWGPSSDNWFCLPDTAMNLTEESSPGRWVNGGRRNLLQSRLQRLSRVTHSNRNCKLPGLFLVWKSLIYGSRYWKELQTSHMRHSWLSDLLPI